MSRNALYVPLDIGTWSCELLPAKEHRDYAAKMLGYDRKTFSDMIHAMKDSLNLGGANNVIWHGNGDVEFNGQIIGNMHDYQ